MTEQLASMPEESTTGFTAPCRPRTSYHELIQAVPVSGSPIRWSLPNSQSGRNGLSSYSSSGASNSCPSNNSGNSSGTISVSAAIVDNGELTRIAHQMVNDGYIWHMVQAFDDASSAPAAFKHGGGVRGHALENWFLELDIDWVLQIDDEHGLQRLLRDKPVTTQELVDKWVRALTVIVASITETEYEFAFHRTPAVALFGKASITEMLNVVDVIVPALEAKKLQAVLDMFACVCGTSHMIRPVMISREAQSIFKEIGNSLEREGIRLSEIISNSTKEVRTLVEEDDSWAIEILRGRGEVHKNTRFIMDCIVSMTIARTSMHNSAPSNNSENLDGLIDIEYLLLRKSWLLLDPSLRYLFLLNNSYFVAHVVSESSGSFIPDDPWDLTPKLTPECKKYMDSYLDFSWGHVLSCIPKSRSLGLIHRLVNTPSLAKFQSAFHETYQAQKFWKVPDPRLREALRRAIIERVITGYRNYLEEHPELEKHVGRQSSSPQVLEEMLGELYEG
ncbi:exocyst complex component EXO70A3-like [Aegilops tauschii subsp. strangulata]|uniref:Exocyst subunit Exo70 family protein n=1 Tax=Aegilops tauschii TaxID=37682 RepID=M8BV92_AEGTA|nr:exocyst complex component EXO70B1-like [Aegilops tauschii subsp. strangulata]